jgi:hypothetical protein
MRHKLAILEVVGGEVSAESLAAVVDIHGVGSA